MHVVLLWLVGMGPAGVTDGLANSPEAQRGCLGEGWPRREQPCLASGLCIVRMAS